MNEKKFFPHSIWKSNSSQVDDVSHHVIMKLSFFYSFKMQQNATNFVYSIHFVTVTIAYNLHNWILMPCVINTHIYFRSSESRLDLVLYLISGVKPGISLYPSDWNGRFLTHLSFIVPSRSWSILYSLKGVSKWACRYLDNSSKCNANHKMQLTPVGLM